MPAVCTLILTVCINLDHVAHHISRVVPGDLIQQKGKSNQHS